MNDDRLDHAEAARSRMRSTISAIDDELARLSGKAGGGVDNTATRELRAAWASLVDQLALGPEPERRACPVCGRLGMRQATVCGYCWTRLAPLPAEGARGE
jgi:hypothetical protein